jgi:hypothetical protein
MKMCFFYLEPLLVRRGLSARGGGGGGPWAPAAAGPWAGGAAERCGRTVRARARMARLWRSAVRRGRESERMRASSGRERGDRAGPIYIEIGGEGEPRRE